MSKDESISESDHNSSVDSSAKSKSKREKNAPPTKVVVRGLPPTMIQETFIEQVSPLPDHDYLYFVRADLSLGQFAFSRAYINFLNQEDIFIFTEKFDGYVFVDQRGNEYPAVVEFAPFQKVPKKATRKKDSKVNTIETDADYLRFLEQLEKASESDVPSTQEVLEQIEAKERNLRANHGVLKMSTPLLDFIKHRKEEKIRFREEKKEERRRREAERRKLREEERRRPKEFPNRDTGRDKAKSDKVAPKILTHSKNKDSQEIEDVTKKVKNLKMSPVSERSEKQGKEHREKERSTHQDKDSHREKHSSSRDREKDRAQREKERIEREKERFRRREEERVRKNAERKAALLEKKEKEQRAQEAARNKESGNPTTEDGKSTSQDQDQSKDELDTASGSKTEVGIKTVNKNADGTEGKTKPERIRNKVGTEQSENIKNIKNKDRPSIQIYRPGMLKKRAGSSSDATSSKSGAGQDSASTSASSSPTPPLSGQKSDVKRRSSAPPVKSKSTENASESTNEPDISKSDDDKSREDIPVKSRTFKRSFS